MCTNGISEKERQRDLLVDRQRVSELHAHALERTQRQALLVDQVVRTIGHVECARELLLGRAEGGRVRVLEANAIGEATAALDGQALHAQREAALLRVHNGSRFI